MTYFLTEFCSPMSVAVVVLDAYMLAEWRVDRGVLRSDRGSVAARQEHEYEEGSAKGPRWAHDALMDMEQR